MPTVALDTCILGPLALLAEMYSTMYIRTYRRRFIPLDPSSPHVCISSAIFLPLLNNHIRLLFIRTLNIRYSSLDLDIWSCALGYQDLYSTVEGGLLPPPRAGNRRLCCGPRRWGWFLFGIDFSLFSSHERPKSPKKNCINTAVF